MQALGLVWGNADHLAADIEEIHTVMPEPTQFGARLLLEHWRLKYALDGFVVGRDVPSRALSHVLRNLAVYEPIDEMADFRVRLAGSAFIRRFGRDTTRLRLSEIYAPRHFEVHHATMRAVIDRAKPHIVDIKLAKGSRVFLHFEKLRLPVLAPDRKSVWVLGGLFCFDCP